jgi:hypothetical protein
MQIAIHADLALYIFDMCAVNGLTQEGFVNSLLEKGIRQDVTETYGEEKAKKFVQKLISEVTCDWSLLEEEPEEPEPEKTDFQTRLESWLKGVQVKIDQQYADNPFHPVLETEEGSRYIRIVKVDPSSRSAFAFIDKTNGDVLKVASWKAPAKKSRGNIFDEFNGLKYVGAYGPAYLR